MSSNGDPLNALRRRIGKQEAPPTAGARTIGGRPSTTMHGLEVILPSDIARVILPDESQNNAQLLDTAAGHIASFGTPPQEYICITAGVRLVNGVWQYEPGSSLGRVIRLDPDGVVYYLLVVGTPMVWYIQAYLDGYGDFTVTGGLTVEGGFSPTGILGGSGPNNTVRQRTNMARLALSYDFSTGPTSWQSVPFNATVYDTSGLTGKVPSAFIVPIPGYYTMHAQVTFGGTPGNVVGIRFMLSDQQTSGGGTTELGNGMQTTLHAHQTLYCTPSDAVWVQYTCYNSDMINGSGLGWTFMEIHYLGE